MTTIAIAPRQTAASRVKATFSALASALSDTADVAWRNLLTQLRTPQALVFATVQPVIFVLLFRYAFGGAIHVPGTNYVDFLMPGIFAQTVAFGAVGTAVGLSGDLRTGILVRFRTLPMARIAVLGGRTVADLARNLLVVAVMTGVGFAVTALSIYLLSRTLTADGPVWPILATFALLGIGMAGIWAPLAATATRNLPMAMAGAGSGVYNATRQVGAVLGSAAIAVLLDSRIAAHGLAGGAEPEGALQQLPAAVRAPFSAAMADTLLLPVAVLLLGFVAVLFFQLPRHLVAQREQAAAAGVPRPEPTAVLD